MKKSIAYLILFSLLIFSCSENEKNIEIQNVDLNKINQVVVTKNQNEQKILYSMLNKDEKFTLWNNKLNKIVTSNLLNENQKKLIKNFLNNLESKHFIENSDDELHFKTIYIPQYLETLKENFTTNQIGYIFYTTSYSTEISYEDDGGAKKNCDCNRTSMVSCVWLNNSSCINNEAGTACKETFSSCGFMWAYTCNGICKPV